MRMKKQEKMQGKSPKKQGKSPKANLKKNPKVSQEKCRALNPVRSLVVAAVLATALCFGLAACSGGSGGSGENDGTTPATTGTVTMLVDTSALDGGGVATYEVEAFKGMTAFDALKGAGVAHSSSGSSYGTLVTGINGIEQGQHGEMSGWLYAVNDRMATEAADKTKLKAGDTLTWTYVLEFTDME